MMKKIIFTSIKYYGEIDVIKMEYYKMMQDGKVKDHE